MPETPAAHRFEQQRRQKVAMLGCILARLTSQIGGVLHIHYPPVFTAAVRALAFLRDISSLFLDAECVGLSDFVSQWLLKGQATSRRQQQMRATGCSTT